MYVQTDASELGVEHQVTYFSRKLLPQGHSTIEKECKAIKLAVQAFRVSARQTIHNPN